MISLDTSILSKLDSNLYSGKVSWPLSTVYSIFEALENSLKNGYFFQCMSILGLLKAVIFYWKLSFSILNYFSSRSNEISGGFFNGYLAGPQPTLGHCWGGSLINPMLVTVFWFWNQPKGHWALGPKPRPSATLPKTLSPI